MLLSVFQRLFAIVSLAILGLGAYGIWTWWHLHETLRLLPAGVPRDPENWCLWLGGAAISLSLLGRAPVGLLLGKHGQDGDRLKRRAGQAVTTPDGARLCVESYGPPDAPVLILVHGWGLEAGMWWEARRALSERFRVVAFDLAGLGRSTQPADGHYSIERFADELKTLVKRHHPRQVILVGHSIGGMIVQTFCVRHPDTLRTTVAGIVLENTTHTDPSKTTVFGNALHFIKPLLQASMYVDIWLQPVSWLMNWQSYLSGTTHIAMRLAGFGTPPTRAQLEQVALDATRNPPAVQAKGNLAMMRWKITEKLGRITVPALVFIGGRDLVTRPSAGEAIIEQIPLARAIHIAKAGHMGPLEFAADYNRAISDFAERNFLPAARRDGASAGTSTGALNPAST